MAWPSGSKAGTTNVDADTDNISNARADIKQNIDNVNDIIDTFNIGAEDSAGTPEDGQLIQYSSTTGKWEAIASSTIGNTVVLIELVGKAYRGDGVGSNNWCEQINELYDSSNISTLGTSEDSAGGPAHQTLPAGNYFFQANQMPTHSDGGSPSAPTFSKLRIYTLDSSGRPAPGDNTTYSDEWTFKGISGSNGGGSSAVYINLSTETTFVYGSTGMAQTGSIPHIDFSDIYVRIEKLS